jgi:hypothetical protein
MLLKAGLFLGTPFLLMALLIGASGVVVVDVHEGGPDGHHFVIPVPLFLAQAALTFAPHEAKYIPCEEFAPYQELSVRVLEELEMAPDGLLVEVHDGGETVLIRKVGKNLQIDVESAGEEVHCTLPIQGAIDMIEAYDGHGFPTKAAIGGIRHARRGTLVHVKDASDEVRIRVL